MPAQSEVQADAVPTPSPALRRLDRLVGTWRMEGRTADATEDNVRGTTTYRWLNGDSESSFFLLQDMEMEYDGTPIRSHELIGYDSSTEAFSSSVYSNMAPDPWPYQWDVRGDELTISIEHGPMAATFKGTFSRDGATITGSGAHTPAPTKRSMRRTISVSFAWLDTDTSRGSAIMLSGKEVSRTSVNRALGGPNHG
jgi:hypothetical protein